MTPREIEETRHRRAAAAIRTRMEVDAAAERIVHEANLAAIRAAEPAPVRGWWK